MGPVSYLRQFLKKSWLRTWELCILCVGHILARDSLHDINQIALTEKQIYHTFKPMLNTFFYLSRISSSIYSKFHTSLIIVIIIIFISLIIGQKQRIALNIFGCCLVLRTIYQIICSNILLFSSLRTNHYLLIDVILIIVQVTLIFGWIYWRLDALDSNKNSEHINLPIKTSFHYFYYSALGVHSRVALLTPSKTKIMQIISYLHACIMFDLFGLTLSHAMALAIKR